MPDLPAPPASAVNNRTGIVGLAAFLPILALCLWANLPVLYALLLLVFGTAAAMIVHDLAVERVHLRPTTGLDFARRNPPGEVRGIVAVKFFGLVATLAGIALIYAVVPYFRSGFGTYFVLAGAFSFALLALAPFYLQYTTTRMVEPRDELWHFGAFVLGRAGADRGEVARHLRAWAVKGFFLAFMIKVTPSSIGSFGGKFASLDLSDPATVALCAIAFMFLIDAVFGTIGYLMTFRVVDAHIRSANPFLTGWVAALICYPPFAAVFMGTGGVMDYRSGGQQWTLWMADNPVLLSIWGVVLVVLAAIYGWSTAVFGLRFSNLTHRGIITVGPYRYVRHPAYLSKNLFWWLTAMPFLSLQGPFDAFQNCVLLAAVNLVYFARARTEERHLLTDPDYVAYCAWLDRHGLWARVRPGLAPLLSARGRRDEAEPAAHLND